MVEATSLAPGSADASALVLDEALSFWGGVDPATGAIVDVHHPQRGELVTGRVLVLPSGRGSSSSSSVLAEAIRLGTGPAAIVLAEPDPILALASLVAAELYGIDVPIVVVDGVTYASLHDGDRVVVEATQDDARVRSD